MKKMIREALMGSVMVIGLLMVGGDLVSAEEHPILKDSSGNSVEYGKEYYMETYEFPGYKLGVNRAGDLIYELYLHPGQHTRPMEITFEKRWKNFELPGDMVLIQHKEPRLWLGAGLPFPWDGNQYVSVFGSNTSYLQLMFHLPVGDNGNQSMWTPMVPSADMDPKSIGGNYFAFKNEALNVFFACSNPDEMRSNANVGNMDSKTMWRLIPVTEE
ncbi:hypothetical protein CUC43_33860 (plasmid) [Bacillus thuringiensis LM1212]|uniref:hypothetical protein n=1 Tax=Bacillus cereus group TaxID=86661 RepID=UPI000E59D9CF|nr:MULTISPECIES: hypothetical protein [Bacillus cereus group]AXY11557.1 hypothetical protein CUC43_33860 [Bacillus thuringiensis LM1212]QDF27387.1 hypothetical protein FJR70_32010 [Bacillus tropicus]QUG99236.1 hypothetical protein HCM98_30935 [Bacillus tropicus]